MSGFIIRKWCDLPINCFEEVLDGGKLISPVTDLASYCVKLLARLQVCKNILMLAFEKTPDNIKQLRHAQSTRYRAEAEQLSKELQSLIPLTAISSLIENSSYSHAIDLTLDEVISGIGTNF